MSKLTDLRNKRAALWEQTKAFLEEHRNENGLVDAASVEQYNKMTADVKAIGEEIKRLEDQMEMESQLAAPTSKPVLNQVKDTKEIDKEAYNKAFWEMMRGHGDRLEVRNALSVGVPADGGYTVPDEFERHLVQALEDNNIFRSLAHVIKTSSGTRKIPVADDSIAASWIDEGTAIPEGETHFAQATLGAYKLGKLIKVSNELLNDSAFNIANYIADRFGVAMGRAEEEAFISGNGTGKPTGIITTASAGVTATSQTEITFDEIFQLYYSLKAPYRSKATFICNEDLLLQIMLIKDTQERYIWKPSLDIGKPDTILGRPIVTSSYVPTIAAGAKVMLFGDISYYWIADRGERTFKRLNELYAAADQVGFVTTQRVDGKLILPEAVKVLKLAGGANG